MKHSEKNIRPDLDKFCQVWKCAVLSCGRVCLVDELVLKKFEFGISHVCPDCESEDIFPALDQAWIDSFDDNDYDDDDYV